MVGAASASRTRSAARSPRAASAAATANAHRKEPVSPTTDPPPGPVAAGPVAAGRARLSAVETSATPIAEASWRCALNSAEAWAVCCVEMVAKAAVWAGIITKPIPKPTPNSSARSGQRDPAESRKPRASIEAAAKTRPPAISRRGPILG